jgi:hypothetical protein
MSEQSTPLEHLTHKAYLAGAADRGILDHITHVGDFSYTAQTNFLGGWSDEKERRVTLLLQSTLQNGLEESGFHNLASLEAKRFRDGIEFQYLDPDYQFSYALDGRGRILLSRPRSSSAAFHEWYRRFMPSFTHIVLSTVQTIDNELTGLGPEETGGKSSPVKPREKVIQVERASYSFNVAVEIEDSPSGQDLPLLPNIQVLNQTLLSRVPSGTGSLSDPVTMGPEEFGRIDYSVSRWNHQKKVAEHYSVSAPSNNRWRLLLFKFGYVGETYIPSAGERQKFNQDDFLTGETAAEAYLEFFRQKCLCGFIRDVLYGDRGRQGLSIVKPLTPGFQFVTPAAW